MRQRNMNEEILYNCKHYLIFNYCLHKYKILDHCKFQS